MSLIESRMRIKMLFFADFCMRNFGSLSVPWTCRICDSKSRKRALKDVDQHFRQNHPEQWREAHSKALSAIADGQRDWRVLPPSTEGEFPQWRKT